MKTASTKIKIKDIPPVPQDGKTYLLSVTNHRDTGKLEAKWVELDTP